MTFANVPELRHAALARAQALHDRRVVEVLERSAIEARERSGDGWESSDGTVRAVDVRVIVDGYALGLCDRWPAVRDGVVAVVTAEAPRVLGASVLDLSIVWGLRDRAPEAGYRDSLGAPVRADPGSDDDVRRAIAGFLAAGADTDDSAEPESDRIIRARLALGRGR